MDAEIGQMEKRVRRRRTIVLACVISVVQFGLLAVVFLNYQALSSRSAYGASLLVSSLLCGLGQSLYQAVRHQFKPLSIAKFQVWGVVNGLWTKFWTNELAAKFDHPLPKLLWDQALGNPIGVFLFTSLNAFWEGHNVDMYLQRNFRPAWTASLIIWPIASAVEFFVLDHDQVFIFNAVVNFVWNLILSLLT